MSYSAYAGGNTNAPIDTWIKAQESGADAITAKAGGGQATATVLAATCNNVVTVASAADSVQLPLAAAGLTVFVKNTHATNAVQVFAANGSTDTIDGTAGSTGTSLAATKAAVYFCALSAPGGKWFRILTA